MKKGLFMFFVIVLGMNILTNYWFNEKFIFDIFTLLFFFGAFISAIFYYKK